MTLRAFRVFVVPLGLLVAAWIVFGGPTGRGPQYGSLYALEIGIVIVIIGAPLAVLWRYPRALNRRSARRALIIIGYGGFAWYVIAWAYASASLTAASVRGLDYGLAGLALGLLSWLVLLGWYRREQSLRPDERAILRNSQAFSAAFQVMILACAAELLLWYSRSSARPTLSALFPVVNIVLAISLPVAALAWSEPDSEFE